MTVSLSSNLRGTRLHAAFPLYRKLSRYRLTVFRIHSVCITLVLKGDISDNFGSFSQTSALCAHQLRHSRFIRHEGKWTL